MSDSQSPWLIYLEVVPADQPQATLPPFDKDQDVVIFFKFYCPFTTKVQRIPDVPRTVHDQLIVGSDKDLSFNEIESTNSIDLLTQNVALSFDKIYLAWVIVSDML